LDHALNRPVGIVSTGVGGLHEEIEVPELHFLVCSTKTGALAVQEVEDIERQERGAAYGMALVIVVSAVASQTHLRNKLGSLSVQGHARDELAVLIVHVKLRVSVDGDGHLKKSRAVSRCVVIGPEVEPPAAPISRVWATVADVEVRRMGTTSPIARKINRWIGSSI